MPRLEKPKENQCFWEASELGNPWIFGFFGFSPNGKPRPWLDRTRPGKSKNAIFGKKTFVFLSIFGNFPLYGGFPWVPYWPLLAPL